MTTVKAALDQAAARLAAGGVESARTDAALLLAHVLGVERSALLTRVDLDDGAATRFGDLVARRADREPLQYLTGEAPFRFAILAVGPGVFIPRPETELLVDAVLPELAGSDAPLVVDLCAGSGALAVAIAQECPSARVVALERSPAALAWLRRNTAGTSIEVVAADVTELGVLAHRYGQVDVVVTNPPYVPSSTVVGAEVAHDPGEAVFAGPDGLSVITSVVRLAAQLLRAGGVLAIEHDDTHGDVLPALLDDSGQWTDVADHHDLTGRSRYATAVRRARPDRAG